MKVYRSRIGWEIWGPVILVFVFIIFKTNAVWPVVMMLMLLSSFIATMVLKTRYIISDDNLLVECWPAVHSEIAIKSIHRIRDTWNPLSSPAASYIGRIELQYDKGKSCIISPKDKKGFITDLCSRNKSILTFEGK